MSVFKRPDAPTYSYDFQFRGRRFSGSTGCKTKQKAKEFEEELKRHARAAALDPGKPLTFEAAVVKFWEEVGQFHAQPKGTEAILRWLVEHIGGATQLSAINNALVANLVAQRRGEGVSPATVNRSMVEPLRNLMRRADEVWEVKVARINWGKHRMKEPEERVREATHVEEVQLLALVPESYRPAVRFAILTGCRRGEIVGLRWPSVNFEAREFRVTGKGKRSRTIPMTDEVFGLLEGLKGHHKTAVFTFAAERTKPGRVKGLRYPITAQGFNTMWHRYVRGKVPDFRFHDTRHTAATRLVRATGNLRLAQRLLGHTNVTTTARYAHVTHDDLRAGLEAMGRLGQGVPLEPFAPQI